MHWCAISFESVYPACTYIHASVVKKLVEEKVVEKEKPVYEKASRCHISFMHDVYFREQRDMLYR